MGLWSGWSSVILYLWAGNAIEQTIPCAFLITLLKMSKKYLRKNDTVSSFTAHMENKPVETLLTKISSSTSRNFWSQSKLVQKKKIVILIQWNLLNTNTKTTKRSHPKWCNWGFWSKNWRNLGRHCWKFWSYRMTLLLVDKIGIAVSKNDHEMTVSSFTLVTIKSNE